MINSTRPRSLFAAPRILFLCANLAVVATASAGEVYATAGLPGFMLGYVHPLTDTVAVRADVATLRLNDSGQKEGVDYRGQAKLDRAGVFADWFAFARGGFRLTGGITFNDMRANVTGRGRGQLVTVGANPYLLTAADRFDVQIRFPRTTPYIGMGWGHQPSLESGWGFVLDLGASIGKAKVTGDASGPVLSSPDAQQDFQRELRERADKTAFIPQISVGLGYRF